MFAYVHNTATVKPLAFITADTLSKSAVENMLYNAPRNITEYLFFFSSFFFIAFMHTFCRACGLKPDCGDCVFEVPQEQEVTVPSVRRQRRTQRWSTLRHTSSQGRTLRAGTGSTTFPALQVPKNEQTVMNMCMSVKWIGLW